MKTAGGSPSPHSPQTRCTSPAPTPGLLAPYLFRPAVGAAPAGVGAIAAPTVVVPLTNLSTASGDCSTLPSVMKSTTSAENSTGLSVWMVSGVWIDLQHRPVPND